MMNEKKKKGPVECIISLFARLVFFIWSLGTRILFLGKVIYKNKDVKKQMKGSCIYIANHTDHNDGFFVPHMLMGRKINVLVTTKWYNKKKYNWSEPRYKGMAYHVKTQEDVQAVKDCVKNLKFDQWADALRKTFNNDSIIRIRVEKGLFKQGDNALIDREVFKKDTTVQALKDYPIDAVYGKILKKGPEDYTDVKGAVTADYQDELEKIWVAELRRKYPVVIFKEVLQTVNKH